MRNPSDKKIREANVCIGMIAEVQAKAKLMKIRLEKILNSTEWSPDQDEAEEQVSKSIEQMKIDLPKYYGRLNKLHRELKDELHKLGGLANH